MAIPHGDGGFSCLCSHGLHSIHVNLIIHDFLGKERHVDSMLSATTSVIPLLPVTPRETCVKGSLPAPAQTKNVNHMQLQPVYP